MANDMLALLARLSIVITLSMLLICLVRAPARRALGPEPAYWLWLLVPASLIAALLPRLHAAAARSDAPLSLPLVPAIKVPVEFASSVASDNYASTLALLWVVGGTAALAYCAYCQYVLKISLGVLQRGPDGTWRSTATTQPMLIGAWHPKIVLPADFETRYSPTERTLVLAHERVHVRRQDALANCLALVLVCLFWFNPITYLARGRFRFDQEVACDAAVLRQLNVSRRCYARALAKTQLSTLHTIGFGWRSRHPLVERVAALKRAAPSRARHLAGYTLALMLMFAAAYVVWAAQPDLPAPKMGDKPRVAISLRWFIEGSDMLNIGPGSVRPEMTPHVGDTFSLVMPSPSGVNYGLKCAPSLRTNSSAAAPPRIFISCEISREVSVVVPYKVISTPAILMDDGRTGTIEVGDPDRKVSLRMEFNASTSASRLKAADGCRFSTFTGTCTTPQ